MNKTKMALIALFVAGGSFAALTLRPRCPCNPGNTPQDVVSPPAELEAAPPIVGSSTTSSAGHESSTPGSSKVVAYYFHRTVRCHTCLAIEDLSRQTIEKLFVEELADGRVEWRPVNIEQKGNEHFEDDYKLMNQSLVLVKLEDGKEAGWKNLTSVWDLIDNQEAFVKYVQEELSKYIRS